MAYRKTEKVLAAIEARRSQIIAAGIDTIAREGLEGLLPAAVSKRAGLSVGLVYHYFADMVELEAAIVFKLADRDLALLREAVGLYGGIRIYARHIAKNYRLLSSIGVVPGYREVIQKEMARMLRAAEVEAPAIMASVVYGALFEAARSMRPHNEKIVLEALARALGATEVVV